MLELAEAAHAVQIATLHAYAFLHGWSADDFLKHIENAMDDVLVWAENGEVFGFVVMRTQDDQAEVLTIVVSATRQNKGLGAKILNEGERYVARRGADIVFLDVAADTPAAVKLYQKTGYQRCGTRRGYYRREKGRVDAFLFSKHI
ncbi:MAG: hypothetical protein COA43_05705 [Robiginitomaculum sp.]|nr:MAG: hypothetical protein COA43_05705 [Robiginitomaculum sp.]